MTSQTIFFICFGDLCLVRTFLVVGFPMKLIVWLCLDLIAALTAALRIGAKDPVLFFESKLDLLDAVSVLRFLL